VRSEVSFVAVERMRLCVRQQRRSFLDADEICLFFVLQGLFLYVHTSFLIAVDEHIAFCI